MLTDEPKCRVAVEGVLQNVEVLQVARGEIHEQTLEALDSVTVEAAMRSLKNDLLNEFKAFQSKVSGIKCNFQSQIGDEPKDRNKAESTDCSVLTCRQTRMNLVEFTNYPTLTCRHTLSFKKLLCRGFIWALKSYVVNGETFLVRAGTDRNINV